MADQAEKMETSLSEDLESAIDMLEDNDTHEEEETSVAPEAVEEEASQEEVPEPVQAEQPESAEVEQPAEASPYKPPIDWSPTLKEEWNGLPPNVQEAIAQREHSVQGLMQQTAEDRRTAQTFNNVVGQFRGLMAAEGVQDPMQGITGLLTTTAQLAMGAPQQKAAKIAELINHYGVDISTLDSILAGQQPETSEDARLQQLLDQRMQPVNQLLEQMNQQRAQQVQQVQSVAYESIHEFGADPSNEFFENVRYDMADFLDMAAQQGRQMSLKEAYDRACALNPEIADVLAKRPSRNQQIAQKEAAASSVHGSTTPGGSGENSADLSLRDALEASFGDAERRI